MKVKELIDKLQQLDPEKDIMRSSWEFCDYHKPCLYEVTVHRIEDEEESRWVKNLCSDWVSLETKDIIEI